MSEPFRERHLRIHNRLAELAAKHGPLIDDPPAVGIPEPPSWGPLGSLLRRYLTAEEIARLMLQHRDMLGRTDRFEPEPVATSPAEPSGADW